MDNAMGDTYCIERKQSDKYDEMMFLDEVSSSCPLCGNILISRKKKNLREFEIAHIYPNSPNAWESAILKDVERLGENSEDPKNKIALCKSCHGNYDNKKTLEEYNNLFRIKKELLAKQSAKIEVSSVLIEDEIYNVILALEKLTDADCESIEKLNYTALKIDEKIKSDYSILRKSIKMYVTEYYSLVQQELKNLDQIKKLKFELIASEIKTAYFKCAANENDQNAIFESLVSWLKIKSGGSEEACRIIVSFFVQNCEVYDKISE